MNKSLTTIPNSKVKIQERLQAGRISRKWPVIMVFARLIFAVLLAALVAGLFMMQGHPTPWQAAAPWWIVYGTLIDLGCLVLLAWLARREGIRLLDLISFERQRLGSDLLIGLGLIIIFVVLGVGGSILFALLIYGTPIAPPTMGELPLWGAMYSLLIWPIIWALAEEMTYQGYSLPRLEVLSRRGWLAVLIVGFGWAIQHSAMPLIPDGQWVLYRFVSNLAIGIVFPILYLRIRRLLPFIIAHWAANFISVLMVVVLPLMTS